MLTNTRVNITEIIAGAETVAKVSVMDRVRINKLQTAESKFRNRKSMVDS